VINLTIAGNVGRNAELRRTQNGDEVLGFSLAVDNGKDKNGNKRDTTWVKCSIWGKRASSLENYVRKGTKLVLTGRPGVDVYEGKGSLTLSVQELTFMGGGEQREQRGYDAPPANDDLGDDIPF
jgi:single-strand DNA-binding protein